MDPSATATATRTESDVERRLAELRDLASAEPAAAQARAWAWIQELGRRKAEDELAELFRLGGAPPADLDGRTEGILVAPLIHPLADQVLRRVTGLWMPWLGKRFDAGVGRGDNLLAESARWPSKLIWPLYGTRSAPGARSAFDFETALEPGKLDPDTEVLKIDYAPVESNPRLVIRQIRDELVEVVPHTYLGKILWRRGEERFACIGYFALRQPAA